MDWLRREAFFAAKYSVTRGSPVEELSDELVSYAVSRANDVFNTWRPDGGASITTHMRNSLVLYMRKRAFREMQLATRIGGARGARVLSVYRSAFDEPLEIEDATRAAHDDLVDRDHVASILAGLPPTYRAILQLRLVRELKFSEIAEMLGVTTGMATRLFNDAIQAARTVAGVDQSDSDDER